MAAQCFGRPTRAGLSILAVLTLARVGHAQGAWTVTGPMTSPRDAHAAVLTDSAVYGSVPLLIGGRINPIGHTTHSTEYYVPPTLAFVPAMPMTDNRSFFPAVKLNNGKILAAGGYRQIGIVGGTIAAADVYDPLTGAWTPTGSMRYARELHSGTKLPSGQVLMAGGFSNNAILATAELYNPASGLFSAAKSMRSSRFGHTATLLAGGKVFVTGGRTTNDVSLSATEFYEPASGGWTAGPVLKQDRFRHTGTVLNDGRILYTGGYSSSKGNTLATAEVYDPTTNAFTLLTSTMSDTRMDHTATLMSNGKVLIVGGWSSVKGKTVASADVFDPATNTFTPAPSLPISRHEHTAILLPDGTVFLAGGLHWEPNDHETMNDAYIYIP
jgi:hypothetical protein